MPPDSVRCITEQCPVHQGTRRPTSHLREFSEALRYNSPDMSGVHRTVRCNSGATATLAPTAPCVALNARAARAFNASQVAVAPLLHRTVRCTPDSPVNYSEAPLRIPEGEELSVEFPGAPDTVRWCTGQSGAPDQGSLRLSLALFVEPNSWSFYWLSVNLWHLYNL